MLLTNIANRQGIIYIILALMEMAWLTPIVMLLYHPFGMWPPVLVFVILCSALLAWMLTIDLLNHFQLETPIYELSTVGLIILSSLAIIIVWPLARLEGASGGLWQMFWDLGDLEQGIPVEIFIVLANIFLWQRATNATSREMSFFSVALSFRLGLLWLIIGGAVYTQLHQQGILSMVWLYFSLGLAAVALARIDEKATDSRSVGKGFPRRRLAQLVGMITLFMAFTVFFSALYTPNNLRQLLIMFTPLWQIFIIVIFIVIRLMFFILEPIMNWLTPLFIDFFNSAEFQGIFDRLNSLAPPPGAEQAPSLAEQAPDWIWVSVRCGFIAVIFAVAVGLAMLLLDRTKRNSQRREAEQTAGAQVTLGGSALQQGWERAKGLAKLVGQYGFSRKLLAAISVENMYANICRMAAQRGHPRPPSQAPDNYLLTLKTVFEGEDEALVSLTQAYMQAHYGNYQPDYQSLEQLRSWYHQLAKESN